MYETKKRTIAKMITFKVATVINALVWNEIFGMTFWKALPAALCMNATGLGIYYLKERVWNQISWGKNGASETGNHGSSERQLGPTEF